MFYDYNYFAFIFLIIHNVSGKYIEKSTPAPASTGDNIKRVDNFGGEEEQPGFRCTPPFRYPERVEKIIGQCQDEIKEALLREALEVIGDLKKSQAINPFIHSRKRRQASSNFNKDSQQAHDTDNFSEEERRVAGCLLQCVYRKANAVDENNFPSPSGLLKLFTEGYRDRNYYAVTNRSVNYCMSLAFQYRERRLASNQAIGGPELCDLAFDMFNCVSDQIERLCESQKLSPTGSILS